ncbi:MAG TPA: hypothetical protein DEP47_08875 [Chloroflexi bacterium]|nr:hypothetical protein [Chloroflexota bacterium]
MARGRVSRISWRKVRASWRDTILLLREFAWPLFLFILTLLGAGILYYLLAAQAGQPVDSVVESIYLVLSLAFLQPIGDFPDNWYLQVFYFVLPIITLGLFAYGLADFGRMFFNRKARSKEWEMAVASTFEDHIVLIGLGHLGFRVARQLFEIDQDVVVIELNPQADLITAAHEMGIPVIEDDGKRMEVLQGAGTTKARAIIICTQNDNLNLQIAFKARKLKPEIQVVVRIFDDEFAQTLEEQFGFEAMSATRMAAPIFASAATGIDITRPITVEGESFSLACLDVRDKSKLIGKTVSVIEQDYKVSVVLLRHDSESDYHPAGDRQLSADDVLAVLAGPEQISQLVGDN